MSIRENLRGIQFITHNTNENKKYLSPKMQKSSIFLLLIQLRPNHTQPVARSFLHNSIAKFIRIILRLLTRGIPLNSSLHLSIMTLGFWFQLSQSCLNLNIQIPLGSSRHPSRLIRRAKILVQSYYYPNVSGEVVWKYYISIKNAK